MWAGPWIKSLHLFVDYREAWLKRMRSIAILMKASKLTGSSSPSLNSLLDHLG